MYGGSGKMTQTILLNAVGASITVTINKGFEFKTYEDGAAEFLINIVTNRVTEGLLKKGSKHNVEQLHGKSRKSSAKAEKSKQQAEKHPNSEKKKKQYQNDKSKMKKDKRKETAATMIHSTFGQYPEGTRTVSEGAAQVLSEKEKRKNEAKNSNE